MWPDVIWLSYLGMVAVGATQKHQPLSGAVLFVSVWALVVGCRLFASRYAGQSPWDAARQLDLSERLLFGCRVRLSPDESVSRLRRRLHLYPCRILVATDRRLLLITPERASIKDGDTERQRVRLAAGDVRFEHDLPVPEGKALAAIVKRRTGPQDC